MFEEEPPHPLETVLGLDFGLEGDGGESDTEIHLQGHCTGLAAALAEITADLTAARERRHATNAAVQALQQAPYFEISNYVP